MLSDSQLQLLCGEIEESAHTVSFQNEWVFLAIKTTKNKLTIDKREQKTEIKGLQTWQSFSRRIR